MNTVLRYLFWAACLCLGILLSRYGGHIKATEVLLNVVINYSAVYLNYSYINSTSYKYTIRFLLAVNAFIGTAALILFIMSNI